MANSEYTVRVRVQNGTDVEGLKKALEGLGATVVKTRSRVSDAAKAHDDLYDTQKKGIIGTANSTKSFSKLAETIGNGGSSGLVGAYATLAANTFAVVAAFNALRGASQVEQIFRGLEAAGARTGISLNTTARALKEVTGAAISTEQAMRSTAQIASAGFSSDAVLRLGAAAKDASFALGRNMTDSLDRLSRGVVKLEPELLDELGIMTKLTESNTRYAQQLGKSEGQLSNFEKRTGFMNAVLAEAELKFGGLSKAAGDSTAYDRLAASFTDLTNTIMNVVNTIAKPIAGILASSSGLMLGAITLFASSLKGQLVPALASSVVRAKEAAAAYKDYARSQVEAVKTQTALAASTKQANVAAAANFRFIGSTGARIYQQNREEILKTIGTTNQLTAVQQKGLNSLAASIRANKAILENNPNFAKGTTQGDTKRTEQANLLREQRALTQLTAARQEAANTDVKNIERVAAARQSALSAILMARSQESAAAAVGAAAQLNVGKAWESGVAAVKRFGAATTLAMTEGTAGLTLMQGAAVKLRTGLFAVSLAAKSVGTALLTLLPWIGLATVAFGLLQTAYNSLKTDAVKELEKNLESFNEVAGKAVQYGNEMARANDMNVSSATRSAASLTIQSNAVREIAENYETLLESQKKVDSESVLKNIFDGITGGDNSDKVASFWETLGARSIMSYNLGIRKNSKVLDLGQSAQSVADIGTEGREALKTLNTLNEAAPKALEDWVNRTQGGWVKLNAAVAKNPKLLQQVARAAEQDLSKSLGEGASNIKAFQESMKQLETDLSAFYRSAAISTPFDAVVKSVTAANNSIQVLSQTYAKTGEEWKGLLTSFDGNTSAGLSVGLQTALVSFNKLDAAVQKAKASEEEFNASGKKSWENAYQLREAHEKVISAEKTRNELQVQLGNQALKELETVEKRFLIAQDVSRQSASQLTLLQASITANSAIYKAGAAGMRAKIADEERVRDLQKLQLQVQIDVLKASVAMNESRAFALKQQIETNSLMVTELETIGKIKLERQRAALAEKGIGSEDLNRFMSTNTNSANAGVILEKPIDAATGRELDSYLGDMRKLKTVNDDLLKQRSDLRATEQASRDINASIKSLSTQIAAINKANLTTEQKTVAYQRAELEFRSGSLTALRAQEQSIVEVNNNYRDASVILSGNSDSLVTQIALIRSAQAQQKKAAGEAFKDSQRELAMTLKEAQAEAARADQTAEQRTASAALVASAQEAIRVSEQGLGIEAQKIDSQAELNILQKVYFDTQKEGLDWQQTALDIVQKQVDAQKQLSDSISESYSLRQKLDAKRGGYEISQFGDDAAAIKVAEESYRLAVAEVGLKKALIDLEFALLDAQRQKLKEDLIARRDDPTVAKDAVRIAQLNSTISRLESVDLTRVTEAAKTALDKSVENARITLETAITPTKTNNPFMQMIGDLAGIRERSDARKEAENTLANAKETPVAPVVIDNRTAEERRTIDPKFDTIVSSNKVLVETIKDWIKSIESSIGKLQVSTAGDALAATEDVGVNRGTGREKQALDFFVSKGFTAMQAAAIAGNLKKESGFDFSNHSGDGGNARGLAQWNKVASPDRVAEFARKFGHSLAESTFQEQLEFIVHELNSTEKAAGNALRQAKTLEEATLIVSNKYERPNKKYADNDTRIRYARDYYTPTPAAAVTQEAAKPEPGPKSIPVVEAPKPVKLPELKPVIIEANAPEPVVITSDPIAVTVDVKLPEFSKTDQTPQQLRMSANDNDIPKFAESKLTPQQLRVQDNQPVKSANKELNFDENLEAYNKLTATAAENLKSLGPDGEAVAAVVQGASLVTENLKSAFDSIKSNTETGVKGFANDLTAVASVASAALSTISSVLASTAQAKEAAIDREIAAEQKRDGKSAESLAKIASLEKRKDEIAKKQFNTNKKLMMAQAVISTAAGIAQALGSLPPPASIVMAGLIGAMGAAQLAIIAGTSYQSSATTAAAIEQPSTLSIGKRGDNIDLAKQNTNVGGELGYLRGKQGTGTNSSNYSVVGSAYGGELPRGYGNTAYVVGEKGPETITPETAITVRPASNDSGNGSSPIDATFHINALDASGVEDILVNQKGNLIAMLREAANANGQPFLESVNINSYSRPNKTGNTRL